MLDIVILAAGKGTRMKSDLPKVLQPLAGRPLLQHVLDTARALGASGPVNTVIGHGAEQVEARLGAPDVRFILQTKQLGTGHAVQQALPHFEKDHTVLILYGDVPLIKVDTLQRLAKIASECSLGLLTLELEKPSGYGRIVRDGDGQVTAIVEQKDASDEQLAIREINTGIMAVKGKHLQRWLPLLSNNNAQSEYYLTDIIALANADGVAIQTEQASAEWEVLGINNHRQQAQLERIYQLNIANQLMDDGLTLLDPSRFDCRGTLRIGQDVIIDINCVIEGDVELGNNVTIGPNCTLKNASIGDHTAIKANTVIEDSVIADHCEVGPFARLRPQADLRSRVKIGNFVEVKKSTVGEGSKANHLAYLGDTEMGKGANVGAGTIVCNYDGANKHKTVIGDEAFIGSNTALVAPVKVGKGATVGAGSTINRDVPDEQLSVARGKQTNIEGWKRPVKKRET